MKLILITLIFSTNLFANTLPYSKGDFCKRFNNNPENINTIQNFAFDQDNLISFKNDGGLFNGGVCWWHSRFQRNAFYSAILKPELNRPTIEEAKAIIKSLRNGTNITIIPGFNKFSDFTDTFHSLIQDELNRWQIYDGVVLGGWIDGIKGDTQVESEVLRSMMNEINDYVSYKHKVAYQKLQIKGITSHAWLVTNTKVDEQGGLILGYIDSNDPTHLNQYNYKIGDNSFYIKGYGNFVPYLEFKREEEKLVSIARNFCDKTFVVNVDENAYQQDLYDFEHNL